MPTANLRRHPRIYEPVEVNYYQGEHSFSASTKSLSMGGLYVKTDRPLDVGSLFLVDFSLPGCTHNFRIRGEVIWRKTSGDDHGPSGMGVRFLDVREDDKRAFLNYLGNAQVTRKGY